MLAHDEACAQRYDMERHCDAAIFPLQSQSQNLVGLSGWVRVCGGSECGARHDGVVCTTLLLFVHPPVETRWLNSLTLWTPGFLKLQRRT